MCVAAAIAGATIAGGAISAIGSESAASTQASADETAAQTQQNMFNTIVGQESPYMQAGNSATSTLSQLLGTSGTPGSTVGSTGLSQGYLTQTFNPTTSQLENYPGYQFQLQQGDLALQSANSATGSALGGAALKQLSSFNQGLAASNYSNYFNQFQTQQNNIYDRLSGIASLGQNAASNTGNAGAQLGTGVAQSQAAAGAASAAGTVGATNAVSGGLTTGVTLAALLGSNSGGNFSLDPAITGYQPTDTDLGGAAPLNFGS